MYCIINSYELLGILYNKLLRRLLYKYHKLLYIVNDVENRNSGHFAVPLRSCPTAHPLVLGTASVLVRWRTGYSGVASRYRDASIEMVRAIC